MDQDDKIKPGLLVSLITSLGLGGGSGAAISYYIQEAHGKSIEKLELRQDKIELLIFVELKEMNTRLSTIEGRLEK